jgi:SHS2 domain-containing protein
MYELFEHTADLGIRARAQDLSSLFAEAARALFAVIVRNPDTVRTKENVEFHIDGTDREFLLVDWLCELLFAFESRRLLLSTFSVTIDDIGLHATAQGEPFDKSRHELEHEVKAVTYHGLSVEQDEKGWSAQVILDI